MSTFLFDQHIFGPIKSRRLGYSLGINLLSNYYKVCNFDCIYCECGWTDIGLYDSEKFVDTNELIINLEKVLKDLNFNKQKINNITFAGNGEPTLHPHFDKIVDATIDLRNKYYPQAGVSLLSNAATLHNSKIKSALKKLDNRILKLDAGTNETFCSVNKATSKLDFAKLVDNLANIDDITIQSIFIKSKNKEQEIDNTTDNEIDNWITQLKKIQPREVMIYTISRDTPLKGILKIPISKLKKIAKLVVKEGINAKVY